MDKSISFTQLEEFEKDFHRDPAKRVAQLAVTSNGVNQSAADPFTLRRDRFQFSVELKTGHITNQKASGRCWLFAAMNTMRMEVMKKLNLEDFELSQNYLLFYDKLEKSNYFLESILETLDEPTNGRLIAHLLTAPLNDGGQWDMLCNIVDKYGVVPKDAMPETACSSSTGEITSYMTRRLREFACTLREGYAQGRDIGQLRKMKEGMLCSIYNMLCIALGNPPKTFAFEIRDKDNKFIRDTGLTGRSFYEKYVGWELSDYVSLINATTKDKPFHRTFTVKLLGNVKEGRPVKYLNLPVEELKQAAVRQLEGGSPVWFGCDVGKSSTRKTGIMDLEALRPDQLFGVEFGMDKAQRLDYCDSLMTHAMVFQGVNLDENGAPDRWKVENSWGDELGEKGYFVMSDNWFTEYTYQVVIHKKYLTDSQRAELEQAPIELEPWDPMGSLA